MNTIIQIKKCPYCAESIHIDARKCKHCGEILDEKLKKSRDQAPTFILSENKVRKWSPGVAALLSFLIPGVGQMYKGNVGTGLFWFIIIVISYFAFFIIGIILHLICIFSAASGDPYK